MPNPDYGILQSWALWSIPIVAIATLVVIRGARLRKTAALAFNVTSNRNLAAYYTCACAVSMLLTLAILRPYWGSEEITVNARGQDVIFLVDVSRSMFAQDVPPSRIELAKRKLKDVISSSATHGHANRFGITLFAGDGYTVCPLTADTAVVKQFIDVISPELVTSLGSNLEAGISNALSRLDAPAAGHSRIIVLSDGEDGFLNQTKILDEVSQKRVRLDIIGIGTPAGSTVKLPNGSLITDGSRSPVVSQLREDVLKTIAAAASGTYVRVTLDDTDINALFTAQHTLALEATSTQSTMRNYRELGPWLSLTALVILLGMACLTGGRGNLFLAILFAIVSWHSTAFANPLSDRLFDSTARSPYTLYEAGEFERAAEEFAKALKESPHDRGLKQGLASALFKSGKFKESQQFFHELAESAKTGREYFENVYNEGNSLLGMKRFADAIDAYGKALDTKPNDPQALHNMRVARALWEEEKNAPTPTPTPNPSSAPSPAPSPTQHPSPSAQPTSSPDETQQPSAPDASPTSSPATPSISPGATGSPSSAEQPQPTVATTSSPQATDSSGPATPSPSENQSSPSPTERQREAAAPTGLEQSPAPIAAPTTSFHEQPTEADAWLQSLPDSPLLIRRYKGARQNNGQTW